jgi:DNA-directed RNA polymerase specialized sigma24 family protein
MSQYTTRKEIEMLTDAGLLTERQAEAFVLRRIECTPGYAVAEEMGISEPTLSGHVSDAENKIEAARETLNALEEIRWQAGKPPSDE